jgi:phosphohistidine phosphatase
MDLLLIRHAIAEDRGAFATTGRPDRERPLTARGVARMERAAQGLRVAVPELDAVGTSPYVRARQTADIMGRRYGAAVTETETLEPGAQPEAFAEWLCAQEPTGCVAAVGHEPDLSELAAWLATRSADPVFSFKKGGACLLSFAGPIAAGTGELQWVISPRLLRQLGTRPA